jgi:hypothetical protein
MPVNLIRYTAVAALVATSLQARGEVISGDQPLLCALSGFMQCEMDADCARVSPESINAARFLEIDFETGRIEARLLADDEPRVTRYERSETMGDLLVLQGAEGEVQAATGGLGYTLTLTKTTGHITMAAAGDRVSFVVFGACLPLSD